MTKLDQVWAQGIRESVNALILEVERLEALGEKHERQISIAIEALKYCSEHHSDSFFSHGMKAIAEIEELTK